MSTNVAALRTRLTVTELLGLFGVLVGLWYLGGPVGVVATLAVAALLLVLPSVYGFAAGQFALAVVSPSFVELILLEAALVLVLVGGTLDGDAGGRFDVPLLPVVVVAALTVLAVAVGLWGGAVDETLVAAMVVITFVAVAASLYLRGRRLTARAEVAR